MNILQTTCKDRNIEFNKHDSYVRYLAYMINLVIQTALLKLKVEYVENESEILNNNSEINDVIPKIQQQIFNDKSNDKRNDNIQQFVIKKITIIISNKEYKMKPILYIL